MEVLGTSIEDRALTLLLQEGPLRTSELLDRLRAERACTRQGFYRALRKLKSDERVVVHRTQVAPSELWLRRARNLFNRSQANVGAMGDFSALADGERLALKIKGLTAMDRLWSHVFSVIEQRVPLRHPLFLFNPHNWSALYRNEADRAHENVLRRQRRLAYLVIGSGSMLDKEATRAVGFEHVEFSFNPRFRQDSYVAAIGDFVIDVKFDPKTRKAIRALFAQSSDLAEARQKLQRIDRSAVCKISIEKDARKARVWSRRLARDFHIPRRHRP